MSGAVLIILTAVLASPAWARDIAVFDGSSEVSHGEWQIRQHLDMWLTYVDKNGLDKSCHGLFSEPQLDSLNMSLALVVPDRDATECDEYTFSGEMADGVPHGKGTLKFKAGGGKMVAKPDKVCMKRGSLFGSEVAQIKGNFKEGLPQGKVYLKWGKGIKAEVFVYGGVPHGVFKIVADENGKRVWSVGNVREGVVKEECWVITNEQVLMVHTTMGTMY